MACVFAAFDPSSSGERRNFVACESPNDLRTDSRCCVRNNGDDDDGCDDGCDEGSDCDMDEVDGAPQVYHGDVLQVVSDISKRVLAVDRHGKLTATGDICPSKCVASEEASHFHCHAMGVGGPDDSLNAFLLLPVSPSDGNFKCPMPRDQTDHPTSVRALTVTVAGAEERQQTLAIEEVKLRASEEQMKRCLWYLAPASTNGCGHLWRVQAKLSDSEEVYVAADHSGNVYATFKDKTGISSDHGLNNPQTYFYLYRKCLIDEDPFF